MEARFHLPLVNLVVEFEQAFQGLFPGVGGYGVTDAVVFREVIHFIKAVCQVDIVPAVLKFFGTASRTLSLISPTARGDQGLLRLYINSVKRTFSKLLIRMFLPKFMPPLNIREKNNWSISNCRIPSGLPGLTNGRIHRSAPVFAVGKAKWERADISNRRPARILPRVPSWAGGVPMLASKRPTGRRAWSLPKGFTWNKMLDTLTGKLYFSGRVFFTLFFHFSDESP